MIAELFPRYTVSITKDKRKGWMSMNKKLLVFTFVLLLTLSVIAAAQALAPVKIVVNGTELETDVAPVLKQGRVLAPSGLLPKN